MRTHLRPRPCLVLIALVVAGVCSTSCSRARRDWEEARGADTGAAYQAFLTAHPDSEFAPEARARLQWEKTAAAGTIAAYESFLAAHAGSELATEARAKLAALYERRVLVPVTRSGKEGYLDPEAGVVVEAQLETAREFVEGRALVRKGQLWGFADKSGRLVVEPRYKQLADFSEGLAPVEVGGKWGFIDGDGKMVVAPRFEDAWPFVEGVALVEVGNKWGFVDHEGKEVIAPRYDGGYVGDHYRMTLKVGEGGVLEMTDYADHRDRNFVKAHVEWLTRSPSFFGGEGPWVYRDKTDEGRSPERGERFTVVDVFSGGRARLRVGDRWGYIDRAGQEVVKPQYEFCARFVDGRAMIRTADGLGFIDETGSVVVRPVYSGLQTQFSEGLAAASKGGAYGYLDRSGRMAIPARFDDANRFSEGLAAVKVGGRWGYVDRSGTLEIPAQFGEAGDFSEGLAAVSSRGKWGYVDRSGRMAIGARYDGAKPFRGGVAEVQTKEGSVLLDRKGTVLWTADASR